MISRAAFLACAIIRCAADSGGHDELAVSWGQPDFTGVTVAPREASLDLRQQYRTLDTLVILGAQRPA